jgi:hypothetical protein
MKLTYETATATLIQFIVLGLLNIANGLDSIVTTCHHAGGDCVGNIFSSLIFYILTVGWFGAVLVVGYAAQERRSKRLAQLLIAAEGFIGLVALFNVKLNLKYHSGFLSLGTSLADLLLAIWIITLAYRLMRAGGKRITPRNRSRKRKHGSKQL